MKFSIPIFLFASVCSLLAQAEANDVVYQNNFIYDPVLYDDWSVDGGRFIWVDEATPYIKLRTAESNGQAVLSYEFLRLTPGQAYAVSVDTDFYGEKKGPAYVQLGVRILNGQGELVAEEYRTAEGNSADFKTLTVGFTAGSDGEATVQLVGANKHWEPETYFKNFVLKQEFGDKPTVVFMEEFDSDPIESGWDFVKGRVVWREKSSLLLAPTKQSDGSSVQAVAQITLAGYDKNREYQVEVDTDFYGDKDFKAYCTLTVDVIGESAKQTLATVEREGGNGAKTLTVRFNSGSNSEITFRLSSTPDHWNPEAYFDNLVVKRL